MKSTRITLALILNFSLVAMAQYERAPINTDRPDQSNTPIIIPRGALQIESGFKMEKEKSSITRTESIIISNGTTLKYGVNRNFELHFSVEYADVRQGNAIQNFEDGLKPPSIGAKIKLADKKRFWPQAAILSHVYFNQGSSEFNAASMFADIIVLFAHDLNDRFTLSHNWGAAWNGDNPEATLMGTLSLGINITEKLGAFAELYTFKPEKFKADHRCDAGFTYKPSRLFQIDLSGGMNFDRSHSNFFVSTGCSIRLLK